MSTCILRFQLFDLTEDLCKAVFIVKWEVQSLPAGCFYKQLIRPINTPFSIYSIFYGNYTEKKDFFNKTRDKGGGWDEQAVSRGVRTLWTAIPGGR